MDSGKRPARLTAPFGRRLAQARIRLHLSQEALAEAVGVTSRSIIRWEQDVSIPQPYYRERLCAVLQSTPEALFGAGEEAQQVPAPHIPLWQVPYPRNRYFIGREVILRDLHTKLHAEHRVALTQPHVVCGLGGIGKTQTALEYAYRFRGDYQAVLWVGAETYETLMLDYRALAQLFQLPEKDSTNQTVVRTAVKRWFECHTSWLLIFDNMEDLELLHAFLPDTNQGHILITTCSQIIGTLGIPLDLPKLDRAESALLLLRRARLLTPNAPLEAAPASVRSQANALVDLFDGLPLALDQAGAYIEETACSLADYLERYASHRSVLLSSRGTVSSNHPASVLATLSLAFAQLEHASPEAADLLRLCAFLHAEAIPEAFLTLAGDSLGPQLHVIASDPLLLDRAIKTLRRYSLLQRDPATHNLSIHRLVQAMLQEGMEETERNGWIERLIHALLHIFPSYEKVIQDGGGVQTRCQPYLPHALVCAATLAEMKMQSIEAAELLYRVSYYFQLRGDHVQAVPLMEQALQMAMTLLGNDHATVAFYRNHLAILYVGIKQYELAEAFYRQALAMRERVRGPEHPEVAESLWRLAGLLCQQARFPEARACAERALAITERVLGPHHYKVALVLNILGAIELYQGQYLHAEQRLQRAISIYEQTLEPTHFFLASSKMHLAVLSYRQGSYAQAALLCQQVLQIDKQRLGPDHPLIASEMRALGMIEFAQQHYPQAEGWYRKACAIYEKSLTPNPCNQAISLLYLGELYLVQERLSRAKQCVQQARVLLGEPTRLRQLDHHAIAHGLLLAGDRLTAEQERLQAQSCYRQALRIGERILGSEHPLTRCCQSRLATEDG